MTQTTQVTPGAATAPAKQLRPVDMLKKVMSADSIKAQFQNALGKNSNSFIASVIDLFNGDTNLQKCNPNQVVSECLKAAVLHLPISKALGFAFVIPYKSRKKSYVQQADGSYKEEWGDVYTPTFQIGYKGLIQLAMRTGRYRTINADAVYEGELRKGSKLTGYYDFDGDRISDKVIGYFCYFELTNGFSKTLYMSVEAMAAHAKQYSKALSGKEITVDSLLNLANLPMAPDSKAVGWLGNFHGMAIKTTIRNLLSKYGYLSVEMENAIMYENESDEKAVEISADHQIGSSANGMESNVIDVETTTFEDVSNQEAPQVETPQKVNEAPY